MEFKFGQLSDLHLDRRFTGGKLAMPRPKAEKRMEEQRAALKRFVDDALNEKWDAALLPGDLFDKEQAEMAGKNFLVEEFNRLAPMPVIITPGNHDPYSNISVYNRENAHYFGGAGQPAWGEHIHIITDREFVAIDIGDTRIVGCAFHEGMSAESSPLSKAGALLRKGAINILVIHGSLTDSFAQNPDEDYAMPFDLATLRSLGFDYAAVGHYHSYQPLTDSAGGTIGAYAGGPMALTASDTGERGYIKGRVARNNPQDGSLDDTAQVDIEFVRADPRRIRNISADITGRNHPDSMREKMLAELESADENDIVCLTIAGRYPPGVPPKAPDDIGGKFFHLKVIDHSESDHEVNFGEAPPEEPPPKDAQDMFVRRMMNRYLDADEATKRIIEEATSYGLDAIKAGEVHLK